MIKKENGVWTVTDKKGKVTSKGSLSKVLGDAATTGTEVGNPENQEERPHMKKKKSFMEKFIGKPIKRPKGGFGQKKIKGKTAREIKDEKGPK